jgi:putative FmdB family regulatory protein
MPLYDYYCGACGHKFEGLYKHDDVVPCEKCGAQTNKGPGHASFKIVGHRAANGYGLNWIDTPGRIEGELAHGYSFTSNKGGKAVDHTRPPKE